MELVPARPTINRVYSASQLDDLKKAAVNEEAGNSAVARVDDTIVHEQPVATRAEAETIQAAQEELSSTEVRSESPATVADTLVNSTTLSRTDSTFAASPIEAYDEYTAQLQNLAEGRKYAEIPAVFEAMLHAGVKPSIAAYNALLSAAIHLPQAKHQVVPKALDVYSDMLRRRVIPDTATYATLIELLSVRSLEVMSSKQSFEEKRLRYGGMEEEGSFMLHSNETDYAILSEDGSLPVAVKTLRRSRFPQSLIVAFRKRPIDYW